MLSLFIEGDWGYMSLITILALIMLFFAAKGASAVYGNTPFYPPNQLYYIRFFGMLALITGVFSQLIGLYHAMNSIAQLEGISPQILAAGLSVSFISTLYGFIIFLIAHLIWFILDMKGKRISAKAP